MVLLGLVQLVNDVGGAATGSKVHTALLHFNLRWRVVTALMILISASVIEPLQLTLIRVPEYLLFG